VFSLFGVVIRARTFYVVVAFLLVAAGIGIGVSRSSHPPTTRFTSTAPIRNLSDGESFTSTEDPIHRIVTYSFPLVNSNSSEVFIRHMGSNVPGLALVTTPAWSTQRPDPAGGSLRETITYHVSTCSLVPRGVVYITFQARTFSGVWQTLRLSLAGDGVHPWQITIIQSVCPHASS
jgi:hypothetical protein